ncbi:hypothetical protein [Yoonia litorea]|uniref:Uncharacterized protein n=1 Tax=Yoonia litorea TaxID=1123755 RepID=A0A1I6N364_9RHOB|nr:hypothetical protein [Yoonia litorea]SFS22238.1 hypothetical protein SAMN05444714_3214 [Yoonia litorea]
MKLGTSLAIGVLVAGMAAATSASAATCANRTAVVDRLENRFGETAIANAISPSNNILEVFAAEEAQTWTILLTLPERNLTCLVSSGSGTTELQAYLETL